MGAMRRRCCGALAAIVVALPAARAQNLPTGCNPKLATSPAKGSKDDAYKARGGKAKWCEGFYQQEVGNAQMRLEALTIAAAPLDTGAMHGIDSLIVEWAAPAGTAVHLFARQASDPMRPYYQLDADVLTDAAGTGRWSWPASLLRKYDMWPLSTRKRGAIRPAAVSLQALGHLASDKPADSVYIPVRVRSASDSSRDRSRFLIALSAPERVDVQGIKLARLLGAEATSGVAMASGCPSPEGGRVGGDLVRITVCMPPDADAGLYLLTVGAVRSKSVRFYYAGPAKKP